ncbi:MAG: cache domain-containing protein [Motiliproteus sp.]|nr:cache domain-containing protein [Motiliproteus sp.]MCW9053837.1 cache domain-containing protein [Motiliproteus sp.]
MKRFFALITSSLRYKLLALVLFPVLLVMPAVIGMAYLWSNEVSYQQLLMKVNTDLSVAHQAFNNSQQRYLAQISRTAESYPFRRAIRSILLGFKEQESVRLEIAKLKQQAGLDFVQVLDLKGCDFLNSSQCGFKYSPLRDRASLGEPAAGVEIFSSQDLRRIDPVMAERVYLPLINTPRAVPSDRTVEDRGMVLHIYYPIFSNYGQIRGYLVGGVLVNGNFQFVDTLRDLVYSKGSLAEDSIGTVTVFLDDVRINTNVPRQLQAPQKRALGTRVSQEVRDKVLGQGDNWIDRAFVVSEWYISAYEPIIDVNGERVGMLYTGFLEAPFKETYYQALKVLLLLFVGVTIVCVLLAVAGAKSIFKPIEAMARVIRRVQHGDSLRIGELDSRDEVAELAAQFDEMLDQLQRQQDIIQANADELELKVEDRTQQLQQKTIDLQEHIDLLKRTREQLVGKEKLAAIGQLTAGIAHEINNPTAVILGNMDMMMQDLGKAGEPVKAESELIIQQVYRIRALINNLLQYSRPSDYLSQTVQLDINQVVRDTLVLVKHDLSNKQILVKQDLRADVMIGGNPQQFQQVLINLIVNATNAMEAGGKLIIRTRNWRDQGVLLVVKDNGCGIDQQILPRIFDPFFTKTQGGSGLGLSVSYGILQRFGGEIQVKSKVDHGSTFFVWLQKEPEVDEEGDALIQSIA